MNAKSILVLVLVLLVAGRSAAAQQRSEPPDVWRQYAEKLPAGAFVKVTLRTGVTIKGHVVQVSPDMVRVEPKTRIPLAVRDLRFDDIAWMSRLKDGKSPGTKVLIGVGSVAATVMALFILAVASIAD
jgi:hypothetical protein